MRREERVREGCVLRTDDGRLEVWASGKQSDLGTLGTLGALGALGAWSWVGFF